jgi:hypothetical protein
MTDALAALRAHAYVHSCSLADLSADVLARRVRLGHDPPPDSGIQGPGIPEPGIPAAGPADLRAADPRAGGVRQDGDKPSGPGGQPGGRQSKGG